MKQFPYKALTVLVVIFILFITWWAIFCEGAYSFRIFLFVLFCGGCLVSVTLILKGWQTPQKTKGCLHNKTEDQKTDFFKSLLSFYPHVDNSFFWQQYFDLQAHEKEEFLEWLKTDNFQKKHVLSNIEALEKILLLKNEKK